MFDLKSTDISYHEQAAVIRFARPRERNPLSVATLTELENALARLIPDSNLKTIVFTGTDGVFASGANLREVGALRPDEAYQFARRGQHLFQSIADAPQLTIAAVNGYCFGGALDLALACRVRLAAPEAIFAHPGARLGIITGWGGTQRLPRLIGLTHALDMLLTGRRVRADEAHALGLVSYIGAPVLECALNFARTVSF
jgi:enoyl-CoA hydratase/carnithine racemase